MPGIIRRPRIGIVDVTDINDNVDDDKPRPQYCIRCKDLFGVHSLLGPRVIPINKQTGEPMPKPADHDRWLECQGCGTVYAKYEVKQEPHLITLVDADIDPFDRDKNIIESVREIRKIDRSKDQRNVRKKEYKRKLQEIQDPDVRRELAKGSEVFNYTETKG